MNGNAEAELKREHTAVGGVAYPKAREFINRDIQAAQRTAKAASPQGRTEHHPPFAKRFTGKYFIDIIFGFLAFLTFLLTYPFVALGIKLSSDGPAIFKQTRTGQNGEEFVCYKFRTMHQIKLRRIDGKPIITKKEDRRVFPFGRFLRRTSLDELPQIINVIKGEMSLIGPRPYPINECSYWNNTFDDFYRRYAVKPGITGLAQTYGFRGGTLDEQHMRRRLTYDLLYVKKCCIATDLKIVGKTFVQIVHPSANAH